MIKNLRDEKVYLEIVDRINAIDEQSTRLWGKMTPHQMISHLTDQFTLLKGEQNFTFKRTFTGIYIYKYLFIRIVNGSISLTMRRSER